MALATFPDEAVRNFSEAYPATPTRVAHRLAGHPLLELDALAELAERMRPGTLEHKAATNLPLGISDSEIPASDLTVRDAFASIETCGSWILLRELEQDPAYRDLLHGVLSELRPQIEPVTGEMMKLVAFIFVSSPEAVTPLHFDPEYNILFQIRGHKTMTLFPATDSEIVTQRFREDYYNGGSRSLPWRPEFEERGQEIHIEPGQGIYVPILAPHWVKTHDQVSISLSLTWQSDWSFDQADTHRFNSRLRQLGLRPAPPRFFPKGNRSKAIAHRAISRIERRLGSARPA